MVALNIDLFYLIVYSLIGLMSSIALIAGSSSVLTEKEVNVVVALLILFGIICTAVVVFYEEHSVEYNKGYSDYPNDALYSKALSLQSDSEPVNAIDWYIDGYESAAEKNLTKIIEEKEFINYISKNGSLFN